MSEELASGRVVVGVNDSEVRAGLDRIEADFKSTMSSIARERATANVNVDLREFKAKLKEAEAELKAFNKEKGKATLTADDKALQKSLQAQVAARKQAVAEQQKLLDSIRDQNAEAVRTAKLSDAQLKRDQQRQKLLENTAKQERTAVAAKLREDAQDERMRQRIYTQAAKEADNANRARQKELADVDKIRAAYAKQQLLVDNLNKKRKKSTSTNEERSIDLDITVALGEIAKLKARLAAIGHPAPDIEVNLKPGRNAGANLRKALIMGQAHGLESGFETLGSDLADGVSNGFKRKISKQNFGNAIQSKLQSIGNAFSNIGNARFNLGPFSASLKGAVLLLGTLGPIIFSVIGALGALVGVAGAAAAGVGALGIAIGAGAVPEIIGFTAIIKPMVAQFKEAQTAYKAYQDALAKGNTKLAASKLKEYNNILGGVDASTKKAFQSAHTLAQRWDDLTKPARAAGFNVIGDAINYANKNVRTFAKDTTAGFEAAATGVRSWIKGLGSAEGKDILHSVMSNFNAAIPGVLHGLGEIGVWLGRIAKQASTFLKPAADGFDKWATSLANGVKDGGKLHAQLANLMDDAKSVGRLFMASGRFLVSFFGAGVGAGKGLVNTLTDVLNGWTRFDKSVQGKQELNTFFSNSVKNAKALVSAIAPLIVSFGKWAVAMTPSVTAFLTGATYVLRFVSALTKLLDLGGGVHALAVTLGTVWAVSKINAGATALFNFTRALLGVAKGEKAVAEAQAIAGVTSGGGVARTAERDVAGVAEGAAATRAAGPVARLSTVMEGAGAAAFGLEGATAVAATGGVALLAAAAIYGGYKLLSMKSSADKLRDSIKQSQGAIDSFNGASKANSDATAAAGDAMHAYGQSVNTVVGLKAKLAKLDSEGKKDTLQYRDTLSQLNQALVDRGNNEKLAHKYFGQASLDQQAETKASNAMVTTTTNLNNAKQDQLKYQKQAAAYKSDPAMEAIALQHLAEANKNVSNAEDKVAAATRAHDAATLAALEDQVNYQRTLNGLIPAAGAAAAALGKLYAANKKLGNTVALKYADPKDAGKVAATASKAISGGLPSTVSTNAVVNTTTAMAAIARIKAALAAFTSQKDALINVGVTDSASSKIAGIVAKIKSMPDGKAKIQAIDAATGTISRIIAGILHVPQSKTTRLIANDLLSGKTKAAISLIGSIPTSHNTNVTVNTGDSVGQLATLNQLLGNLHDKTVSATVISRTIGAANSVVSGNSHASGRPQGLRDTAWVGEGHDWKGAKEYIADHATGNVKTVIGATLLKLKPTEAVIPTENRYKSKGKDLAAAFEKATGIRIPGFAASKKPKKPTTTNTPTAAKGKTKLNLTDHGKAVERSYARNRIKKSKWASTNTQAAMNKVDASKQTEDDMGFEIERNVNKLAEPDSFIVQTGTDANGNALYGVDQSAVSSWAGQLDSIRAQFDALMAQIQNTSDAIENAVTVTQTTISTAATNKTALLKQMNKEKNTMNAKGVSNSEKQAAKARYDVYSSQEKIEAKNFSDAKEDASTLVGERHDVKQRMETATDSRDEYAADRDAVAGKAVADATAANPDTTTPGSTDTSTTPDQDAQLAQAQQAAGVAQRGQGIAESALSVFTGSGDIGAGAANAAAAVLASSANMSAMMGASTIPSNPSVASMMSPVASSARAATASAASFASPVADLTQQSGGPSTIINVNTLHPGDPDTLRAVGDAATAGQSLQGYRPTTRFGTGY